MLIYGDPKCRKSFLGLSIASAISDEKVERFLGKQVMQHGTVLYLQVDTPRSIWAERVEKIKSVHNIDNVEFTDALLVPYPMDINDPLHKEALKECVHKLKPLLVIVDTLREVHNGDEDKSLPMKSVVLGLLECTMPVGSTLLLIAHKRKAKGDNNDVGGDFNEIRGSNYLPGKMDIMINMTPKTLRLKGRSIEDNRISFTTDSVGMIVLEGGKDTGEGEEKNMAYVMGLDHLTSDRQRADLLSALENIEPDKARHRIRVWRKKHGKETNEGED